MTGSVAYPDDLKEIEAKLVDIRRRAVGAPPANDSTAPRIGLALSGGGVRSATFALGILQALAARRCLQRIDFLSTVSGGGYAGAFLSRFFSRAGETAETVQQALDPGSQRRGNPNSNIGNVLAWLRENGRFLAPMGSGDLLTGGATMLRNWVAIHVVVASLLLMLLLVPQLLRQWLHVTYPDGLEWLALCPALSPTGSAMARFDLWISCTLPLGQTALWWSPYVVLVPLVILCWIIPTGWAYWLSPPRGAEIRTASKMHATLFARAGFGFVTLVALSAVWFSYYVEPHADTWVGRTGVVVFCIAALVVIFAAFAAAFSQRFHYVAESKREYVRGALSDWLKFGLLALAVCFVFAVVDSIGQTVYTVALSPERSVASWIGGIFTSLALIAAGARRLVVAVAPMDTMKRGSVITLKAAGLAAALALYLIVLSELDAFAHGLAWNFAPVTHAPAELGGHVLEGAVPSPPPASTGATASARSLLVPLGALGFLVVLNLFISRTWTFINDSTIQPLYRARLARAYLGATNPKRVPLDTSNFLRVTQVAPDDDIGIENLWWNETRHGAAGAIDRGAPLHLINVTVNETLDGRTGVQNNDRRGIGMALGPAGISAGIRHHIVIRPQGWRCSPEHGFRMFDYPASSLARNDPPFEQLSLAQWTGLSGAAFSTGLGARTSLGLSLLAGFFNVRLGHWWNSGVDPGDRKVRSPAKSLPGRLFTSLFPLQSYLFDEFVARFHGTGRRWWYICDGGHFENMGAYELLRRRVQLIVIVDAEADCAYRFEGLSNLVRKARLDCNAEIRFVDAAAPRLGRLGLHKYFGSLERLRPDSACNSACHAALAEVRYDNAANPASWIVYVKPSLLGDEPADITQYRSENPEFPQQPTSDQFFDEAQWESYRRLGEHIGGKVFSEGLAPYIHLTSPP
jgi:hypothetical protein